MATNEDTEGQGGPRGPKPWRIWLLTFALLVVTFAAGGLYISTSIHVQKLEEAAAAERTAIERKAASERAALVGQTAAASTAQATELIKLAALPLSWAVRQALQEKDYREIALYFQQLVDLPNVRRVALVLRDGLIKIASDKKLEGRPAAESFPGAALADDAPSVRAQSDQLIEAVVPIMALNTRAGTLIIDYEPTRIDQQPAR